MKQIICVLLSLMLLSCGALAQEAKPTATAEEGTSSGAIAPAEVIAATPAAPTAQADAAEDDDELAPAEVITPDSEDPAAEAQAQGNVTLAFEDGFTLELPADWLHYEVSEEMAQSGVLYCLSDAEGACWLYIQRWSTDCADVDALCTLIQETAQPQTSGVYEFNGTPFVVYDLTEGDVSCCAALLGDRVLNFVFTPQSDSDFMVIAARIIGTFTEL